MLNLVLLLRTSEMSCYYCFLLLQQFYLLMYKCSSAPTTQLDNACITTSIHLSETESHIRSQSVLKAPQSKNVNSLVLCCHWTIRLVSNKNTVLACSGHLLCVGLTPLLLSSTRVNLAPFTKSLHHKLLLYCHHGFFS